MGIDAQLIEALLLEPEGNTLDFKEAQYPFSGATDDQKSELLKDVLAFANAFRRADAYILLGVREIKGRRAQVVGVCEQLEDAHLQQFISSKTQRPVAFSYIATQHDGFPIGILKIPKQARPIYAVRTFGKVQKGHVYHRRGSATAVATPDEVAQMGAADAALTEVLSPTLELNVVDPITHTAIAEPVTLSAALLNIPPPDEIPDYGEEHRFGAAAILKMERRDYWRELAAFTRKIQRIRPLRFAVSNPGSVAALDVRLSIEIPDPTKKYYVFDVADVPEVPQRTSGPMDFRLPKMALNPSARADRRADTWHAECDFGKIQPHATAVLAEDLYIGAKETGKLDLPCRLFADNLSEPIARVIKLFVEVTKRKVTLDEIEEMENQRFTSSYAHRRFLERYRADE